MLHASGVVLVNRNAVPGSIAIFAGDEIETQPHSTARIEYVGSAIDISPESIVRFEIGEIVLEHGSVMVTTFRQLRVRTGCVVATPAVAAKTAYVVKDTDNWVSVFAQQKDVNLDSHSGNLKKTSQRELSDHTVVHEHEQKSREEHCGAGATLNSPYAVGAGAAVVTGGALCILLCFDDDPPSPASPSKSSITTNHR